MSAAGDTIRAMILADILRRERAAEIRRRPVVVPLDAVQACIDCKHASAPLSPTCPACGSTSLLTLARVLDRKGAA